MRRRKNESSEEFANRYQKQPDLYKEYRDATAKRPGDHLWAWDIRTALKSRGWECEKREWNDQDDRILKIIRQLGQSNLEVIQFIAKSMKFQIRFNDNDFRSQVELFTAIHTAISDVAEIKFSTTNTVWIRFK